MTFRHATLIHKHATQQQRRSITPGVALATTAPAVGVLLLATSGAARADTNQEDGPTNACEGLSAIVLTASDSGSVNGSKTALSSACDFTLELSRLPSPEDGGPPLGSEPCIVTATPSPISGRGTRVYVNPAGGCSGVEILWRVNVAAQGSATTVSQGGASSSTHATQAEIWTTAHAFLMGEDLFDIDMYKNRSDVRWRHTSDSIFEYDHYHRPWGTVHAVKICLGYPPVCKRVYLGDGWTVEQKPAGVEFITAGLRKAWSHVNFHAHLPVLPDPRARTKSILWFEAGGGFSCDFSNEVTNNYWFGLVSECATGRSPS